MQFRDELAGRLDRVLSQGCHIVLVLTRSPFLPPWKEMVSVPLVVVETTGRPEGAMATGQYITTQAGSGRPDGRGSAAEPFSGPRLRRADSRDAVGGPAPDFPVRLRPGLGHSVTQG